MQDNTGKIITLFYKDGKLKAIKKNGELVSLGDILMADFLPTIEELKKEGYTIKYEEWKE